MNTVAGNPDTPGDFVFPARAQRSPAPDGSPAAAAADGRGPARGASWFDWRHSHLRPGWIIALGACIVASALSFTAYDLHVSREQVLSQWKQFATSQAQQLAVHATQTMAMADQTHRWMAATIQSAGAQSSADLRRLMGTREVHDALVYRQHNIPQIGVISLTDAAGDMINFTRNFPPRSADGRKINLSDRDYFVAHRNDPALDLFVSQPVQNKGNGTWTFYLARKVLNAAGEMIGLVLVGVECQYFIDYYRQIAVPGVSFGLFNRDGVNLGRWPEGTADIGRNFSESTVFNVLRQHKGAVVVPAGETGMRTYAPELRIVSPLELSQYPLVVNVRLVEDLVLREWRDSARAKLTATAVWSLLCVLLVFALARLLRRNQQTIAELAAAKRALEVNEAELERKVRERNAELATANRELEAFAYSVSHDLRAPLRGIDGFSKRLEELNSDALDGEARRFIARIRAGTQKLGAIISDLMLLSKVMKSEPQFELVDLSAMAREIAETLSAQEPSRAVDWDIADGLQARADPRLLRTVMDNLLGNAWKYTARRERAVIRFSAARDAATQRTCFCVWDNGAGFDMQYAAGLFEPFKRLHSDHEFEGTGIGLSIVKRALQRQGGTICGEGVAGVFAAFHFTVGDDGVSR